MSTNAELSHLQFENHEDEINYWRNLALVLTKENEEFRQRINALTEESLMRCESPAASPAAKKFKEVSMDPMDFSNICEDVQGLLMQHFNRKNLLTMSEVSKTWNKRVEAGISEKFTLNFPEDVREYRDIELSRKYKHVTMKLGNISKLEAISKVAKAAEDLKIDPKEEEKSVNFPNLKRLELEVISDVDDFFWMSKVRMDQLEELKIKSNCRHAIKHDRSRCPFCFYDRVESLSSQDIFLELFKNMKKLKALDLYESDANFVNNFKRNWSYPEFQLETLKCRDVKPFDGIRSFKSLKSLTVPADSSTIFAAFRQFKVLTTFKIVDYINNGFCRMPPDGCPENKSIKHLSIEPVKDGDFKEGEMMDAARVLLKAAPDVETLYVYALDQELIRFIAETNMKMKTVRYTEVWGDTFEEYEEMLQTQPNINHDIQFIQKDFEINMFD